jgi:hypothetical protein
MGFAEMLEITLKKKITFFLVDGLGRDARDHILVQVLNISHVLHALTV